MSFHIFMFGMSWPVTMALSSKVTDVSYCSPWGRTCYKNCIELALDWKQPCEEQEKQCTGQCWQQGWRIFSSLRYMSRYGSTTTEGANDQSRCNQSGLGQSWCRPFPVWRTRQFSHSWLSYQLLGSRLPAKRYDVTECHPEIENELCSLWNSNDSRKWQRTAIC